MKAPVTVQVFLQALGGKFLGPNAYDNGNIKLSLHYSRGEAPFEYKIISGETDDGAISGDFTNGTTSFLPILQMPESGQGNPIVNYLTPGSKTICGETRIFLPNTNELAMLRALIPTPSGQSLLLEQNVLLNPQQTDYTLSMVVPGLLLTPNTSILVPPGTISVFVAMMCGCKITIGKPTSFWTWTDFTVSARVTYKDRTEEQLELSFDKTVNLSLFTAAVKNYDQISHVNFAAQQKSTANYGALLQTF